MSSTSNSPLPPTRRKRVLLGVTGSVATVKVPQIIVQFVLQGCDVWTILTRGAEHFWSKAETYHPPSWNEMQELVKKNDERVKIMHTQDEWREWNELGDPVMHIDLRKWADVVVVAPLSAHTLAKLAMGLCDDMLTSVLRAWDYSSKRLVVAPAMNTFMWDHPLTSRQLDEISSFGENVVVVSPAIKELACGEVGQGALAAVPDIIDATLNEDLQ